MDLYYKRPVRGVEVITEPVNIVPEKNFSSLMIQTDPIIDERDSHEPALLKIPKEGSAIDETLEVPKNEQTAVLELPMPPEPEGEGDDW